MKNLIPPTGLGSTSHCFERKTQHYKRPNSALPSRFHPGPRFHPRLRTLWTFLPHFAWPALVWLLLAFSIAATAQTAPALREARLENLHDSHSISDLQEFPGSVAIAMPIASAQLGARSAKSQTRPLTSSFLHSLVQQGGADSVEVLASKLSSTPTTVSFGTVAIGKTASVRVALQNTGSTAISVTLFTLSASGLGYSVSGFSLPLSIPANSSKDFYADFKPATQGSLTGTISIASNASDSPLAVNLSGTGSPAGTATLSASPASVGFGSVTVGGKVTQSITLTNSGTTSLSISKISSTGAGFTFSSPSFPFTIAAGAHTSITATFSPTSAISYSGQLAITSTASNATLDVALSGTGVALPALSVSPTSLGFGSVTVGTKSSLEVTLTNSGTTSLTVSKISSTGTGFGFSSPSLPLTLAAGAHTSVSVTFSPTSTVSYSGQVSVVSTASTSTVDVPLSGTGAAVPTLSVNPNSLSFGSVTVGTQIVLPIILTNTGNESISVSKIVRTGNGFTYISPIIPFTIAAGKNASLDVTFSPTSTASYSGQLSIESTASDSTVDVPLSGTGATAHSVSLSWAASTSNGITGYNVYRGVTSGGPYSKLNSALISGISYVDYAVSAGSTYYYVATAVDSSGVESTYSNQATAVIP